MPIITRSMNKKRKRASLSNENENENDDQNNNTNSNSNNKNNNNSNGPPLKKQRISSPVKLIDLSSYNCCICKELSMEKIFQCSSGHLICSECYPKIIPCICPQCRINMNKVNPIRNRMAENTLSLRVTQCRYDGCNYQSSVSKLKLHHIDTCEYKPTICKFSALGCSWKGLQKNQSEHEINCKLDQNTLLKTFQHLIVYEQFCKKAACFKRFHKTTSNIIFEIDEEIYVFNYEINVGIKTKLISINDAEFCEFYAQVGKWDAHADEDDEEEEIDINIGIIIDTKVHDHRPGLRLEFKATLNDENTYSKWFKFPEKIEKNKCMALFKNSSDRFEFMISAFQFD